MGQVYFSGTGNTHKFSAVMGVPPCAQAGSEAHMLFPSRVVSGGQTGGFASVHRSNPVSRVDGDGQYAADVHEPDDASGAYPLAQRAANPIVHFPTTGEARLGAGQALGPTQSVPSLV